MEPCGLLMDARGRRVPRTLAVPFAVRAELRHMAARVMAVREELVVLQERTNILPTLERINEAFDKLYIAILEDAPAVPCQCAPDKDCSFCGNRRWLSTKRVYQLTRQPAGSLAKS